MEPITFTRKYIEDLRGITKSPHKTRVQEKIAEYVTEINWQNENLIEDLQGLFIAAYKCVNRNTWDKFEKRLEWIKGKNLFPKQVMKLLYRVDNFSK